MTLINFNKEMKGYHSEKVTLANTDQSEMRDRRDNGRIRLRNGLIRSCHPLPEEYSSQGSYAMRTMVQDDSCDYDIDDGIYFDKEVLKDSNGNYLGAQDARERVQKALKDDRLAFDAVVMTNCVRQMYPDGYHIDIPIYRSFLTKDFWGNNTIEYELASGDEWTKSDARKVTRWYNDAVGSELRMGQADTSQLRRVTKLTKKMARSRTSWKTETISGICISKLIVDHFVSQLDRDDDALRETWKAIKLHLTFSKRIGHPVFADKNLAEENDKTVIFFLECLTEVLTETQVLEKHNCTREEAALAWDAVFNTDYFSIKVTQDTNISKSLMRPAVSASASLSFPAHPITPNKSAGFA